MKDQIDGFCVTVFHGPQGPVHLVAGSWVDPVSHVPVPVRDQKRLWHAFNMQHQVELVQSGKGPDDGHTGLEI